MNLRDSPCRASTRLLPWDWAHPLVSNHTDQQPAFCLWGVFCVQTRHPDLGCNVWWTRETKAELTLLQNCLLVAVLFKTKYNSPLGESTGVGQSQWCSLSEIKLGSGLSVDTCKRTYRRTLAMSFSMTALTECVWREEGKGTRENGRKKDSMCYSRSSRLGGSQTLTCYLQETRIKIIPMNSWVRGSSFLLFFSWTECPCLNCTK